jgi:hypothetical protein
MTTRSWIDAEPRLVDCIQQLAWLFARGVRRPVLVSIVAATIAAVALAFVLFGKASHSPNYVLRIVETGRDPRDLPRPRRQLAEYVKTGVFTSAPLLDIVRRHGLYPSLLRKSPRAALETFREDIEVEVYRNYFVEERSAGSAPRSARLSVSYKNSNQDVAVAVTRELGALIIEHERSMRSQQSASAARAAKREVDARREFLESRRLEVAAKREEMERNDDRDPMLEVEFAGLAASTTTLALRQDLAERREAELAVGVALEASGMGLSFEVVNDGSLPTRSGRADTNLFIAGASVFFGLPLVIVGVGAFAPRKGRA